jgi:hypothetical protein
MCAWDRDTHEMERVLDFQLEKGADAPMCMSIHPTVCCPAIRNGG